MSTSRILTEALRGSGRRATRQRSLVFDLVRRIPGHPDAKTLFIKAKARDPHISLATVYRTLALLKRTGFVEEDRLGESHAHFEAAGEIPHFHFTCLKCGRIIEFETTVLDRLKSALEKDHNADIRKIHISASGYCAGCRDARS